MTQSINLRQIMLRMGCQCEHVRLRGDCCEKDKSPKFAPRLPAVSFGLAAQQQIAHFAPIPWTGKTQLVQSRHGVRIIA
jgi:hypothetical protein